MTSICSFLLHPDRRDLTREPIAAEDCGWWLSGSRTIFPFCSSIRLDIILFLPMQEFFGSLDYECTHDTIDMMVDNGPENIPVPEFRTLC